MEPSLAKSLLRIVRRVLRTQSKRTNFEVRVLDMARQLVENQCREFTRDVLAKLVVDELLSSGQGTPQLAGVLAYGHERLGTQALTPDSTFAL